MALAALWDVWRGGSDEGGEGGEEGGEGGGSAPLYTFTILTTDASPRLEWLHDRMPVILRDTDAQALWLDVDDPASATCVCISTLLLLLLLGGGRRLGNGQGRAATG